MMPCQWIEVGSRKRLVTRMVTVSPFLQCRVGPGSVPLMVCATPGLPVKLTAASSTTRSNSVPCRAGAVPLPARGGAASGCDQAPPGNPPRAPSTPPAANPWTNRRLEMPGGLGRIKPAEGFERMQ